MLFATSPSLKTFFLSQTNGLWDPQVLPGVLLAGWSWATWLHVGEVVMIIPLPQGASKPLKNRFKQRLVARCFTVLGATVRGAAVFACF